MPSHAEFETARLHARRMSDRDLDYMIAVDTDALMQATLTGRLSTHAESAARLARWIDEGTRTGLGFWLFSSANGEAIGHGGLFASPRDTGFIELGYAVLPPHWGRGYATEMAGALRVVAYELALPTLIALTRTTNLPSRRVLEKAGFCYDSELVANDIVLARYVESDVQTRTG